ncbi:MAG: hypothetical protein HY288_09060 [Planctomycetia bacterium]|nr:hypothetical protein [Planctomycetia bacterium]
MLLLVVLSLLVLFALIGITFVLVASQYRRSSAAAGRAEQYGDDYRKQLDEVFAQIVRDTNNTHSVLQRHSLLNDMYGQDGVKGTITTTPTSAAPGNNQFLDVTLATMTTLSGLTLSNGTIPSQTQAQTPGYFNGCVATFMDRVTGTHFTTRIVGWGNSGGTMRVMAPDAVNGTAFTAITASATNPATYIINGRPFNGTGFGFNPNTGLIDAKQLLGTTPQVDIPYVLMPNGVFFDPTNSPGPPLTTYPQFGGIGGADEDYDASDPQNMFMAYMPATPVGKTLNPLGNDIIPSYHRPDLVAYVHNSYPGFWNTGGLARQVLMRPLGLTVGITNPDHAAFTGSNSNPAGFDPVNGPWDVDNDGDGIADSVWIDFGAPVQTAPDGRRFKPLAAILCLDLDGRLNVNAHGSLANVDTSFAAPGNTLGMTPATRYTSPQWASVVTAIGLGTGYGPADVSLAPLFTTRANYQQLMTGDTSGNEGRYGQTVPGVPGFPFPAYPGVNGQQSPLGMLKHYEYPVPNYPTTPTNYPFIPTAFGTPPDLWARGFVGLDVRGTPLMPGIGLTPGVAAGTFINDTLNNPYELNLSRGAVRGTKSAGVTGAVGGPDNPFSAAELERILRLYDLDVSALPDRLRALLDPTGNNLATLRHIVTTDSFDLPSPNVLAPAEVRAAYPAASASQNILDLLRTRVMVANGLTPPLTPAQQTQINTLMAAIAPALLPNEVYAGLRMDINRPFGNGRDDNGNGVVDEPAEALIDNVWFPPKGPAAPATPASLSNYFSNVPFDADNDGASHGPRDAGSRALYAKHLYVLMLLLINPQILTPPNGIDWDNNGVLDPNETQRGIAQWAINVADFKDRDSIMSPFPYTIGPFISGWTVGPFPVAPPYKVGTDLVWGCERPELLITETLAFHDRRTEDIRESKVDNPTATHTLPGRTIDDKPKQDTNYDQRLRPLGSLFVELYNPWTTHSSTLNPDGTSNTNGNPNVLDAPGEFYDVAGNNVTGVQLNRRAGGAAQGSPVWRLLVVKGTQPAGAGLPYNERKDPDDPDPNKRPLATSPMPALGDDVERSIYFVDVSNLTVKLQSHGVPYYSTLTVDPLLPGRYAVVGSAGYQLPAGSNNYITPIGRPNTGVTTGLGGTEGTNYSTYRRIVLTPGIGATSNQVQIVNNGGTEPAPIGAGAAGGAQPAIAAVINKMLDPNLGSVFRSISISEPVGSIDPNDYPPPTMSVGVEPAYISVADTPFDQKHAAANADFAVLQIDGTAPKFRTIHLQRLANPLVDWDPATNPYLTIDTMTVDLTVFNGVWNSTTTQPDPSVTIGTYGFASLQRGDPHPANDINPGPGQTPNNLWHHETPNVPPLTATNKDQGSQLFQYFLVNSLGYLNKFAQQPAASTNASTNAYSSTTAPGLPSMQYVGAPNNQPFDWLTWNNRPFANAMELMLVPKSRSSRLLYDYVNTPSPSVYTSPAGPPSTISVQGHLIPFFQTAAAAGVPPNFHRLLEYVQTPSRFVGTETELNAARFKTPLNTTTTNETNLLSFYHPPFTTVSNYRDPGKININTIPSDNNTGGSSRVWAGIFNNGPGPTWDKIVASRRGYVTAGTAELTQNTPPSPTYFANPFRTAAGAALTLPGVTPPTSEVNVTLLRPDPTNNTLPLFNYLSGNPIDNSSRNPYFRNQIFQRLANSLTTRSNVYAVWITVGYFEVEYIGTGGSNASIYPDGYQLGQELGSDSGEIKRHRAFYIYDRSIPVGLPTAQGFEASTFSNSFRVTSEAVGALIHVGLACRLCALGEDCCVCKDWSGIVEY